MFSEPLILTFADSGYRPLLEIWLYKLGQLGIKRIRIYALDAPLLEWCRERGVDSQRVEWHGDLRDLWVQRIRIFSALLAAGEEFIHSDADALWIRDPLTTGAAPERDEDLLFSQGTVWPPDVHGRWGFVLCCGWFCARPTRAVRSLFAALEVDVMGSGDDQLSVNRLLAAGQLRWDGGAAPDYRLDFNGKAVQCWARPLRGTTPDSSLSVALLPHREFQRLPDDAERAVVKHYLTPKDCGQKLLVFRHLGLIP